MHFARFLKKDGPGRSKNAEMSSEIGKEPCTAAVAAQVSLDRQLQAWRNNPSWTDEPPEIKVSSIICCWTLLSVLRVILSPIHLLLKNILEFPAILEKLTFCRKL